MTNNDLEHCILEYGKDIYSFCRHLTVCAQEADDLYQDTFLKAIELSAKMEPCGNPKSYLLSIALRIWKNKKRKFAWRARIWQEQANKEYEAAVSYAAEDSLEDILLQKEECETVKKAVAKLPERQKVAVLLYYMEEMSVTEIAKIIKVPAGTVKSRLHAARKSLKRELEDILNEEELR